MTPRTAALALALCLAVACRGGDAPAPPAPAPAPPAPSTAAAEAPAHTADAAAEAPAPSAAAEAPAPPPDPEAVAADLARLLARAPVEQWYGVYMLGRKVGHARMTFRRAADGEPGAVAVLTDVSMRVRGGAEDTGMGMTEARFYAGEAPWPLLETRFVQSTPLGRDARTAVAGPEGLALTREGPGGEATTRQAPATAETLASMLMTTPADLGALRPGHLAAAPVFDWQSERDDLVTVRVDGVEERTLAGVPTRVARLSLTYERMGLTARASILEGGTVLETSLGPGLVLRLEERAVAEAGVEGLDVMATGAALDAPLVAPRELRRVVLRVLVPDEARLPDRPGQRVERLDDETLRVTLESGEGPPVTPEEREQALAPDGTFDADTPAVRDRARAIVGDATAPRDKAWRLVDWVWEHLEKRLATHVPTASAVLAAGVGDCTEHTWLFVALARAAGLPARPLYGVMYVDGDPPSFGYHAWAEVAIDGRWVPVDPTWRQLPADATHLAFGHEAFPVAAFMGGLKVRVLETGPAAPPGPAPAAAPAPP